MAELGIYTLSAVDQESSPKFSHTPSTQPSHNILATFSKAISGVGSPRHALCRTGAKLLSIKALLENNLSSLQDSGFHNPSSRR